MFAVASCAAIKAKRTGDLWRRLRSLASLRVLFQAIVDIARCCRFKCRYKESKYAVSIEQVLALLCEVDKQREVHANLLHHMNHICFQVRSLYTRVYDVYDVTVVARQVLVQSSSSSRARAKRVINQTMFDPDPLVVHELLLTHEFHV
jgi:hypothetical protein